jgi:hypothetical protein
MSSNSTLPTPPDDRPPPADRVLHAVLLLVLAAVLGLAVTGRLGVTSQVASAQVEDVRLSVRHAAATRPGVSTPLDITVSSATALPDQVVIEIGADYMLSFDFNALSPPPAEEFGDGARQRWTFDVPEGADTLGVSLDGRLDPSVQSSLTTEVVAMVGDHAPLVVPIQTRVLP